MSFEDVKAKVEELVKTNLNDLIIIRGAWGVGKTFYWESLIHRLKSENQLELTNYAYISLFGVSDIETVKNQLTASLLINRAGSSNNTKWRIANWIKSDVPKQVEKVKDQIPYIEWLPLGLASAALFMAVGNAVICIDDIERKSEALSIKEILGLTAALKEQKHCKIVFLLNQDTLNEKDRKDFEDYNEKLVDWTFEFSPSPESIFNYIFAESDAYYSLIRHLCLALEIRNIRILKRIHVFVEEIRRYLSCLENPIIEDIVRSLVLFVCCHYDRERDRPSFAFLKEYVSILYDMRRRSGAYASEERADEYHLMLSKIGYQHTSEIDVLLMNFVEQGYLQKEEFRREVAARNEELKTAKDIQRYKDAWSLYRNRFGDNSKEFLTDLETRFRQNIEGLTLIDLDAVVEVLRYFGQDERADLLVSEYVKNRVSFEIVEELRHGITRSPKPQDPYLISKLDEIYASRPQPQTSIDKAMVTVGLKDPNDFLPDEIKVLETATNEDFYKFFKSYVAEDTFYVVRGCLARKEIREKTVAALRKIAKESDIDRLRVSRLYGIDFQDKGEK